MNSKLNGRYAALGSGGRNRSEVTPLRTGDISKIVSRFRQGFSGRPGRKPKRETVSEAARAALSSSIPNDPEGRIFAKGICDKLASMAFAGDRCAAEILFDRAEGRPTTKEDINDGDDPLRELIVAMNKRSAQIGPPPQDDEP